MPSIKPGEITLDILDAKLDKLIAALIKPNTTIVPRLGLKVQPYGRPPIQDGRLWCWLKEYVVAQVVVSLDGGATWIDQVDSRFPIRESELTVSGPGLTGTVVSLDLGRAYEAPGRWVVSGRIRLGEEWRPLDPLEIWVWPFAYDPQAAPVAPKAAANVTAESAWVRPTEAQYLAGDKLPLCRDSSEIDLAIERVKLGRLPWHDGAITYAELMTGYDRIEAEAKLSTEALYQRWWMQHKIGWDLMCAIAILGRKAGLPDWDDPMAGATMGVADLYGRADRIAGFDFSRWLYGAMYAPGGGGPSGG